MSLPTTPIVPPPHTNIKHNTMSSGTAVHFEGLDGIDRSQTPSPEPQDQQRQTIVSRGVHNTADSSRSLLSAPPAPPEQHRRSSLMTPQHRRQGSESTATAGFQLVDFGCVSKYAAYREIRRAEKLALSRRKGWGDSYDPMSYRSLNMSATSASNTVGGVDEIIMEDGEKTPLVMDGISRNASDYTTNTNGSTHKRTTSLSIPENSGTPTEALIEMFTENKINVLLVFLPLAYYSHAAKWNDGSIFILNFLAMVPLASMLGVFTEELAAHTNDVIGGLINATFGNAVELVVAIQALLAEDYRVVQASLIGSVFSNLLLVLGMCFFVGGIKHSEQEFIAAGAVASIAMLGFNGLTLFIPEQFANNEEDVVTISRIGALLLVVMYAQLLFFQLKTHAYLFEGDEGGEVALIPFSWALIGLVVITAIVTVLSEFLVGSIDGFCEEFHLGRSFVGVIILPVVGNAVEHISAVSVAYKNKMDLALGGTCRG